MVLLLFSLSQDSPQKWLLESQKTVAKTFSADIKTSAFLEGLKLFPATALTGVWFQDWCDRSKFDREFIWIKLKPKYSLEVSKRLCFCFAVYANATSILLIALLTILSIGFFDYFRRSSCFWSSCTFCIFFISNGQKKIRVTKEANNIKKMTSQNIKLNFYIVDDLFIYLIFQLNTQLHGFQFNKQTFTF